MKFLRYILWAFFLALFNLHAVNFTWDPNPASDGPVTYRLYTSATPTGPWTLAVNNISGTNATYAQTPVTASYHVTAVNSGGVESDPSNIVTYTKKPGAPGGLRVVFMDWSQKTTAQGTVIPVASIKTDPGAGITANISGPWGRTARSGVASTDGTFVIQGKATPRPFTASAEVTKFSANVVGISSTHLFQ